MHGHAQLCSWQHVLIPPWNSAFVRSIFVLSFQDEKATGPKANPPECQVHAQRCVQNTPSTTSTNQKLPGQSWPHQPHLLQTQASAESGRSLYTWLTDPYLAFLSFLDFLSLDLFLLGVGFLGSGLSSSVEAGLRLAALFGSASTDFW